MECNMHATKSGKRWIKLKLILSDKLGQANPTWNTDQGFWDTINMETNPY